MNILIFGATGRTGGFLVDQALSLGHTVTAFVRDPSKMATSHAQLRVVKGDVLDPDGVDEVMTGQDAVLVALGPNDPRKPTTVFSQAAMNITRSMEKQGVRRLVWLTAFGVGDSGARTAVVFRRVLLPILFQHLYEDHERTEQVIQESGLQWAIVRPTRLTNKPSNGRFRVVTGQRVSSRAHISRADVAACMLRQLETDAHPQVLEISS